MKWLKRKLRDWVREANNYESGEKAMSISSIDSTNTPDTEPVLTFRIYSATNGKILEFRRYDRKTDRTDNSTYIIEKDRDIGEYVAKCLSLEMLK
jgi:hypothetical protein